MLTKLKPNCTGYRGVFKNGIRFQARINIDRRAKYLGTFDKASDAARAFDVAALTAWGFKAGKLNFVTITEGFLNAANRT